LTDTDTNTNTSILFWNQ